MHTPPNTPRTALVAGGAGFVGIHLCEALRARGLRVRCVDNFRAGTGENAADLTRHDDLRLLRHDVIHTLRLDEPVGIAFDLACAASPSQYQADPLHTMLTIVLGTANLLALAEARRARTRGWRASSTPTGPGCGPMTGGSCRT